MRSLLASCCCCWRRAHAHSYGLRCMQTIASQPLLPTFAREFLPGIELDLARLGKSAII